MSLPECTVNTNNIQNLPDSPTLSSAELKQEFDKSGKDLKNYLNEVLLPAVKKLVRDEKSNLETSINDRILADNKKKYHIGKIVMSTDNVNPNTYLGFGTWVLWGAGRVPVGVDTNDNNFNVVEKIGGEKEHRLTVDELAWHEHDYYREALWHGEPITWGTLGEARNDANGGYTTGKTHGAGGSKPHNNLQPYITCYMWKRTA